MSRVAVNSDQPLFSMTNTTGNERAAAQAIASCTLP